MPDFNKIINRKNTSCYKWDEQVNKEALPFWVADADYMSCPDIIEAINNRNNHGIFGYTTVSDRYLNSIVSWYKEQYNVFIDSHWIVPLSGVVLSIKVILELVSKPNDLVIIQPPVYHMFSKVIEATNRTICENKLIHNENGYRIDFENLEQLFKKGAKVMVLCSPHNPIGRLWKGSELDRLAKLIAEYEVILISDEIHSDFNLSNRSFISMLNYSQIYKYLYICNAPSKSFNIAGLNSSYVIIPNLENYQRYQKYCEDSFILGCNLFGYTATIAGYTKGSNWIKEQNKHIRSNYLYIVNCLKKEFPQIKIAKLEATYLMWLDMSAFNMFSNKLVCYLEKYGIKLSAGIDFGSEYNYYVRMNIACPKQQVIKGINILIKALRELS